MKVQILVGDQIVNTQLVSVEAFGREPSRTEIKQMALRAALQDRAITIPQALQSSFRLFDVMGLPIDE